MHLAIFRLYAFMGDLLEVDIGIAAMAEVIAETFTGGHELCLKVREDQVARVFSLVAQEELPEGRPELLHALQAMAKVSVHEREREREREREGYHTHTCGHVTV